MSSRKPVSPNTEFDNDRITVMMSVKAAFIRWAIWTAIIVPGAYAFDDLTGGSKPTPRFWIMAVYLFIFVFAIPLVSTPLTAQAKKIDAAIDKLGARIFGDRW